MEITLRYFRFNKQKAGTHIVANTENIAVGWRVLFGGRGCVWLRGCV